MLKITKERELLKFVLPSQENEEAPAAFLWHALRRKEFLAMLELMESVRDDKGEFRFTLREAFEVVKIALVDVENVELDGVSLTAPLDEDHLDLFPMADVMAFAAHVMQSANLGEADTGK